MSDPKEAPRAIIIRRGIMATPRSHLPMGLIEMTLVLDSKNALGVKNVYVSLPDRSGNEPAAPRSLDDGKSSSHTTRVDTSSGSS